MALGTPLDHKALPGRPRDVERRTKDLPFFDFSGRTLALQGPILDPRGSRKCSKTEMVRLGRHLGGPRRAKRLFQRGSQNGIEKVIEKGSQNESFWDAGNLKKYGKVLQNHGFEGFGKVSKTL